MTFNELEWKIDKGIYKYGEGKIITVDKGIRFSFDAEVMQEGEFIILKTEGKKTKVLLSDIIDVL
ncbi:MAG: hypothetical protein ACRCX8_06515 [Sarcina sp.]